MKRIFLFLCSCLFSLHAFSAYPTEELDGIYCPIDNYVDCDNGATPGTIDGVRVFRCFGGGGPFRWRITHYPDSKACAHYDDVRTYYINNAAFDDLFSPGKFYVYRGELVLASRNPECYQNAYCILDIILTVIRENYLGTIEGDDDLSDNGYGDLTPCSDYEDCETYAENEANCPVNTRFSFDYYESPSKFEYSCISFVPPSPPDGDDDGTDIDLGGDDNGDGRPDGGDTGGGDTGGGDTGSGDTGGGDTGGGDEVVN